MNKTTQHLQSNYKPFLSIVAYKNEDRYYLESHPINARGEMLEGKPLTQKTLTGIADCIYDNNQGKIKFGGIIPSNLLLSEVQSGGEYKLVWYRPEEQRILHFTNSLEISSGEAWVPAMLYVATRSTLYVFALSSNRRPNEKTVMYRAPFHNVSDNGAVCLGSAKVAKPQYYTYENVMQYWDDMFWKSEFSHMNGGNFCKTNGNVIWKSLIADPSKKWSHIDELIKTSKNLKNLL